MLHHVNDNLGVVEALGESRGRRRGPRLGFAYCGQLGAAAPGRLPGRGPAERPVQPAGTSPAYGGVRRDGRRGGVLHQLLPGAGPGRGRGRARRAGLAARLLRRRIRRTPCGRPTAAPWPRSPEGGGCATGSSFRTTCRPGSLRRTSTSTRPSSRRKGFRGALNRYRNVDRDWQDLQPWGRQPITVPSLFIGGERDGPTIWGQRAIDRFPETLPGLRGSHVLPGCGHWVQQERAEEVNDLLIGWLKSL